MRSIMSRRARSAIWPASAATTAVATIAARASIAVAAASALAAITSAAFHALALAVLAAFVPAGTRGRAHRIRIGLPFLPHRRLARELDASLIVDQEHLHTDFLSH